MYFDEIAFPRGVGEELSRGISKSWIWFDSGTTSESKLFSCRATVEPNYNQVRHGRSTTSELGLNLLKLLAGLGFLLFFDFTCWSKLILFYRRDGGPKKMERWTYIVMIANVLKDNFFGAVNQVYFHHLFSPLLHELTTLRAEATFLLC